MNQKKKTTARFCHTRFPVSLLRTHLAIRQTQTEKYRYIQRHTIKHYQAYSHKTGTTNY